MANKYQNSNLSNRNLVKPDCACTKCADRRKLVEYEDGHFEEEQDYTFRPVSSR